MPRVVHFEIPASDPDKAIEFYKNVFGWEATKFADFDYWIIKTGDDTSPGINGGLMKQMDPAQPMTWVVDVASADETCAKVEANGGVVVVPKHEIPTVGYVAYFKDLDGRITGIIEPFPMS